MNFGESARRLSAIHCAITLDSASASRATPQNALPPSALTGRLKPDPTGSIITRSVNCSQVCGLSCSRGGALASGAELGDARAGEAEMQIGRRRAGAAVEHERHRPFDRRRLVRDIGDVEHRRHAFARQVVERQRARGRGVADRAAVGLDAVARHGVGRQQPQRALVGDLAELDEGHRRCSACCLAAALTARAFACATASVAAAAISNAARARVSPGRAGKCIAGDPSSPYRPMRQSLPDPGRPFKPAASRSCTCGRVRNVRAETTRRRRTMSEALRRKLTNAGRVLASRTRAISSPGT